MRESIHDWENDRYIQYIDWTFIDPRHACAARVTVVIVSLWLLVHEPSIALQTIPRIQRRIKVEKYVGFSLKLLRSGVMA